MQHSRMRPEQLEQFAPMAEDFGHPCPSHLLQDWRPSHGVFHHQLPEGLLAHHAEPAFGAPPPVVSGSGRGVPIAIDRKTLVRGVVRLHQTPSGIAGSRGSSTTMLAAVAEGPGLGCMQTDQPRFRVYWSMPADASSQSSSIVAWLEIVARLRTRRATQRWPEVSRTHASAGSAMRKLLW